MKKSLRLSGTSISGSSGKATTLHIPHIFARLAKEDKDYIHIIVRADLAQITLGFVRQSDMAHKLKKDHTVVSRRVQDELGLKLGQRIELELVSLDENDGRAVFKGDPKWFRKQTNRFFD